MPKTSPLADFTDDALMVLHLAGKETRQKRHEYVGTEHLLLGIVGEGKGMACYLLKALGFELEQIRDEVERRMQLGAEPVHVGPVAYTSQTNDVLERARKEAKELETQWVSSDHILLGLLGVEEGLAFQVLSDLGLRLTTVRSQLVSLYATGRLTDK